MGTPRSHGFGLKGSVQILVAVLLRVYPGNFAFDTLSSRLDGVAAWVCCLNVRMKLPLLKIRWPQYQIDERASISISKEGCSPWLPRGQPLCAIIMPSPGRSLAPQVVLGRGRLLPCAECWLRPRVWSQQRRIVGLGIRGRSDRLERNVVREAGLLNGGVVGMGPQTKGFGFYLAPSRQATSAPQRQVLAEALSI